MLSCNIFYIFLQTYCSKSIYNYSVIFAQDCWHASYKSTHFSLQTYFFSPQKTPTHVQCIERSAPPVFEAFYMAGVCIRVLNFILVTKFWQKFGRIKKGPSKNWERTHNSAAL
jgi:hypothetical protein